ncbi:MAG: hypothetical protein HKM95_13800 [Inquilinus sp.]|nr:hypothetical protein [Inquilinus sp.]
MSSQYVLNVPYVSQVNYGNPNNPQSDPFGCWYASCCMISYFYEAGPRLGHPEAFAAGHQGNTSRGITGAEYPQFIKNEELRQLSIPSSKKFTADELEQALRDNGPLYTRILVAYKGGKYGHIIVVVGVIGDHVIAHDPAKGPNQQYTLAKFNEAFNWQWNSAYSLMCKDR